MISIRCHVLYKIISVPKYSAKYSQKVHQIENIFMIIDLLLKAIYESAKKLKNSEDPDNPVYCILHFL